MVGSGTDRALVTCGPCDPEPPAVNQRVHTGRGRKRVTVSVTADVRTPVGRALRAGVSLQARSFRYAPHCDGEGHCEMSRLGNRRGHTYEVSVGTSVRLIELMQ